MQRTLMLVVATSYCASINAAPVKHNEARLSLINQLNSQPSVSWESLVEGEANGPTATWGKHQSITAAAAPVVLDKSVATVSNFTQYLCNGTSALGDCMNDLSKCQASHHPQGACLHSKGGHSLRSHCGDAGAEMHIEIFATSTDCTGLSTNVTQLVDTCQQGGGGAYFVKLECA